MSRGKVVLDGKEYEIADVLDSASFDGGGRMVQLALTPVLGEYDREVYRLELGESVTEYNVGSMEKGSANTVLNVSGDAIDDEVGYLAGEVSTMGPGTAIVIVRRSGSE